MVGNTSRQVGSTRYDKEKVGKARSFMDMELMKIRMTRKVSVYRMLLLSITRA